MTSDWTKLDSIIDAYEKAISGYVPPKRYEYNSGQRNSLVRAEEMTDYDSVFDLYKKVRSKYVFPRRYVDDRSDESSDEDDDVVKSIESFLSKFRILCMFLGYTQRWSDAHEAVPGLYPLFPKIAATLKVFSEDLHTASVEEYGDQVLLDVFASLNEKIELLKPKIRKVYLRYLSSHPFHPLPPTDHNSSWRRFWQFVEKNLSFLQKEYNLVGPLGKRIKALRTNLTSLLRFRESTVFPHGGEVVIQAAHVCCWFYYAEMDQNNMAMLLADLQQKIDLASPEFLGRILEFLQDHQIWSAEFVQQTLGFSWKTVLHKQLVSLLETMAMKRLDLHWFSKDIIPLFVEARSIKHRYYQPCETGHVLIFAWIWFLKAEIFLKDLQIKSSTLIKLSIEDQIKDLHDGLSFLRENINRPKEKRECRMLELIERMPKQVNSLYQSSHAKEFVPSKVRDVLHKFLVQIMLFKARELLSNLLKSHASFTFLVKRQMGTLHEGLIMLIEIVFNQFKEITEDERLTLTYTEEVASGVTSLCNSFPAEEITEEAMAKMDLWLFALLEKVQVLKARFRQLYLQVPMLNFPKIPALGFIDFLQQKLKQLLKWNLDSAEHITHHIETISEDFDFLMSYFVDFEEKYVKNQELKDLFTRLIHVAYEAEYVIDSVVSQSGDEWNQFLWLYYVSEEIRLIKMGVKKFQAMAFDVGVHNIVQTTRDEIPQTRAIGTVEDVVILNDQQKVILNQLTRGSLNRDVVSIVGMAGIGKTTLAYKVYNDPEIVNYFHVRARCYVSQAYTTRDLLLEILSNIIQLTDNIHAMEDEDLKLLLCQSLRRNRYLVFMDDMWDIGAWDELENSFPNDHNGSRILITSRLSDVVSKVTLESDILSLRPLSDEESWELLRMKIYPKQCCAEELWEIGKEIARNCQGLPLSIVAIAGLLKGRNMKPDSWKQVAQSLNSLIVNDPQTRCMDILEVSYNNLPNYLKACFLYLLVFQEEMEILVRKLTWLWMAEGFIQKKDSKSLEDLAEDYLIDLIGRNLITVAKRRSDGRVKSCRVHDLVRAFCLLKNKKENFLELITSKDEPYASFDDDVDLEDFKSSYSMNHDGYRLCISTRRNHFVMSRPAGSYVRSLLFSATTDMYPRCPYDVSFISRNFKLLKVLDLESINMGYSFAPGLDLLILLIYLAVGGDIDTIPSSVAKLRNLETFVVNGLKGKVILPCTIWFMTRLRHLRVKNRAVLELEDEEAGSSTKLSTLVSLSSLSLSFGEHAEEIIRRMPNLRKLSCIFSKSGNYIMKCVEFPRLEHLTMLEALKILYRGKGLNVSAFYFPSSLKKLSLLNFFLRGDQISTIGSLANLEVLQLLSIVFEHTNWEMIEGEFLQLKFLRLESVNIVEWNASSEHLPNLQHLILRRCENLKEVPIDFVDIETLQIIEVQRCRESVEISLRRLKEELLDRYGADNLKVLINQ